MQRRAAAAGASEGLLAGEKARPDEYADYEDGAVRLDRTGITIRKYYFPLATSRFIPLADIESFGTAPDYGIGLLGLKTWGMGLSKVWWALHWGRGLNKEGDNIVVQILDWLYLGADWDASPHVLEPLGITYLLNVKGGTYLHEPNLHHAIVPISDMGTDDLVHDASLLPRCFAFLDEARAAGAKALVHCSLGYNRSPTVVIAYLIARERWTLKRAYEHIKARRDIGPHEEYFRQLQELDRAAHGAVSFTEQDRGGSLQDYIRRLRESQAALQRAGSGDAAKQEPPAV
eukprot:m51a1_g1208 putative dual specificity protein phosphatase 1 isoform 2 (288) ;mRNA; r:469225-470701